MKMKVNKSTKISFTFLFVLMMQMHYLLGMSRFSKFGSIEIFRLLLFALAIFFVFLKYLAANVRITRIQLFVMFVLVAVSFLGMYFSDGMTVVKMLLFSLSFKDVKVENVFAYFLKADLICLCLVSSASLFGIIDNFRLVGDENVFALGFSNSNTLASILFAIAVTDLCLQYSKCRSIWWKGIASVIAIYVLTKSRAPTFSLILMILLVFMEKKGLFKVSRKTGMVMGGAFVLLGILSFVIAKTFNINKNFWTIINASFSWRPYFFHQYYQNFDVLLFGNKFDLSDYGPLDNAYLMLVYKYGIVIVLVYAVIFFVSFVWSSMESNKGYFILGVSLLAYFFMEFTPILINLNMFLVYFWTRFWTNSRKGNQHGDKCCCSSIQC